MTLRPKLTVAAALAAVLAAGCDRGGPERTFEPLPPRDLSMLEVMLEMNPPYLGMQPVLRDVDQLDALAAAADSLARLAEDPRMTGYTGTGDFDRDPEPFERFRQDLLQGSLAAAEAARAGELDRLHDAYSRISASCVACHKRYSPHQ